MEWKINITRKSIIAVYLQCVWLTLANKSDPCLHHTGDTGYSTNGMSFRFLENGTNFGLYGKSDSLCFYLNTTELNLMEYIWYICVPINDYVHSKLISFFGLIWQFILRSEWYLTFSLQGLQPNCCHSLIWTTRRIFSIYMIDNLLQYYVTKIVNKHSDFYWSCIERSSIVSRTEWSQSYIVMVDNLCLPMLLIAIN